jgi:hypothetical protein
MLPWSACLSPSVIFARSSLLAFLSLVVIFLPGAMLRTSGGTMRTTGLVETGSIAVPAGALLGVPAKTGAGRFNFNGTKFVPLWARRFHASRTHGMSRKDANLIFTEYFCRLFRLTCEWPG